MSSIGPSTIASSFDRLLILPGGGGDGANLVSLTDGDAGTTFALKISTHDVSVPSAGKIYLDGGGSTYIHNADNGRIEMWANGQMMLWCDRAGSDNNVEVRAETFNLRNANGDSPKLMFHSIKEASGTAQVHAIEPGGTDYTDDILLLGRTDSATSTNVVLNAKVGIGTHSAYSTGPRTALHVQSTSSLGSEEIHIDPAQGGILQTTTDGAGWWSTYGFAKQSDLSVLGGLMGYYSSSGTADQLSRISISDSYTSELGIHINMNNGYVGIGENAPDAPLYLSHATNTIPMKIHTGGATCGLSMKASGTSTGGSDFLGLVADANVLRLYTDNATRASVGRTGLRVGTAGEGASTSTNAIHIKNGVLNHPGTDQIGIGAKDSAGTGTDTEATLSLYFPEGVDVSTLPSAGTLTHRVPIWINGTCYWLYLDPVS